MSLKTLMAFARFVYFITDGVGQLTWHFSDSGGPCLVKCTTHDHPNTPAKYFPHIDTYLVQTTSPAEGQEAPAPPKKQREPVAAKSQKLRRNKTAPAPPPASAQADFTDFPEVMPSARSTQATYLHFYTIQHFHTSHFLNLSCMFFSYDGFV